MEKILVKEEYYTFDDNLYDKIIQDYLIDNPENDIYKNFNDIITYVIDNEIEILNQLFIPVDENCDFSEFENGFCEYLKFISK